MRKIVKLKLQKISDEVKEFHPLIETIFTKLPNVTRVEYTHGKDEMGADFLIHKTDTTLGETDYVGVIAKIGKITQNTTEIERQIDECCLERFASDGKKKIILSEIWVVTNSTITSPAKMKIHNKYNSKKIKFISQSKLIDFIENHLPNYVHGIPLKIGEYLRKINNENAKEEERTSLLPANKADLYIEHTLEKLDTRKYKKKNNKTSKKKKAEIFSVVEAENLVLIEGAMGAGKTKIVRRIVDNFSDADNYREKKIIPIPISYKRLYDEYELNIKKTIGQTTKENEINIKDNTLLLLIDGVDEVKQNTEDRAEAISEIVEQSKDIKNLKVVITCRPMNSSEFETRLGGEIACYEISPLTTHKVIKFIESLCSKLNLRERIVEDLKKSPLFRVLPRTPIAAILLAKLLDENVQDLPSNMTELYSKYMELSLGRWDIEKGLQSQKEFEALTAITTKIGKYMLDSGVFEISKEEVVEIFRQYLGKRNLEIDQSALFEKLVNRCDVVCCIDKDSRIAFKHKTFAEYFYAYDLMKANNYIIGENVYDLYWSNTYFFLTGLKRDCPKLVDDLVNIRPHENHLRLLKILNLGNFLLAAYSTPYDHIEKGVESVFVDAVDVYHEMKSGLFDSPFMNLSEMHILAILRTFLKEGYSFKFFKNAIETAILNAEGNDMNTNKKALLCFFLDMAYVDVGGKTVFDKMIEEFGASLPIPVQLAIYHETNQNIEKSKIVKKMERNLKRALKESKKLRHEVEVFYEKPISKTRS